MTSLNPMDHWTTFIQHADKRHETGIDKYKNRSDNQEKMTVCQLLDSLREELVDAYNYLYYIWIRLTQNYIPTREAFMARVNLYMQEQEVINEAEDWILHMAARVFMLYSNEPNLADELTAYDECQALPYKINMGHTTETTYDGTG